MAENEESKIIPVIEEELVTGTREIAQGSVRVSKKVQTVHKIVEQPLLRDVVSVSRVAVNRVVESIPPSREEGDVLIIPVIEEQMVVQKRMVLKEEIHVTRRRTQEIVRNKVSLDHEVATVERLDAEGRVIATSAPRKNPA